MKLILALVLLAGCLDTVAAESSPTCADLGCPVAPSGSPELWEPCTTSVCWCRDDGEVLACLMP